MSKIKEFFKSQTYPALLLALSVIGLMVFYAGKILDSLGLNEFYYTTLMWGHTRLLFSIVAKTRKILTLNTVA